MKDHQTTDLSLSARTILIAPSAPRDLVVELERYGARVICWPEIEIAGPESFIALDEAIENLFGYDWLIFHTGYAAEFFLKRFRKLGYEVSELDAVRICAIGEDTITKLEESQMHVDLIPSPTSSVFEAIEKYVGGRAALGRLNFLIPRAFTAHDRLRDLLEEAGARVDAVAAYGAVLPSGESLAHIHALLAGGGIDCVVFAATDAVEEFARLFDTIDLPGLLKEVAVACIGDGTTTRVAECGLDTDIVSSHDTVLADLVASYFLDLNL